MKWLSFVLGMQAGVVLFSIFITVAMVFFPAPNIRQQAIDHNTAEYRCDPVTGETEFVWKER